MSSNTRWGVVIFPGSNCDHDALEALGRWAGQETIPLWHKDRLPAGIDGVVLPGGFSYGDYLRSGAIARFSPIMEDIIEFAHRGGLVIGICNGFQILTESELLPGALMRNQSVRFICRTVHLRVERSDLPFTLKYRQGEILNIPIAHNEGCYYLPEEALKELEQNRQVVFRYCDPEGNVTITANPNGSVNNIAGIVNRQGNVLGMMPHPERRCDPLLGLPHGLPLFLSAVEWLTRHRQAA